MPEVTPSSPLCTHFHRLGALVILLAAVPYVSGQQMQPVAHNNDWVIFVSDASIRRDETLDDAVWADVRLESRATFFLPRNALGKQYAVADMRWRVECSAQRAFEVDTVFRDRSGRTVEETTRDRTGGIPLTLTPNSLVALAFHHICRSAPPARRRGPAASPPSVPGGPPVGAEGLGVETPREDRQRQRGRSGTAFAVSPQGHLLTNSHVVAGCSAVEVTSVKGEAYAGRVIAQDSRNDLALIQTAAFQSSYAEFRPSPVRVGENVVALGFPLRGLLATDVNVSVGIVSAMAGIGNDTSQLQISAPVQPGNSGGPLFDQTGAVVGIVVAKLDAIAVARVVGDIPQNVNFAIKGELAQLFLQSHGVEPRIIARSTSGGTVADIAERGRDYTYLIECGVGGAKDQTPTAVPPSGDSVSERLRLYGEQAWCLYEELPPRTPRARCYHRSMDECATAARGVKGATCVTRESLTP